MHTLGAVVVVASLVTCIALAGDVSAQQTQQSPSSQPGQPSSDAAPSQPSSQPALSPTQIPPPQPQSQPQPSQVQPSEPAQSGQRPVMPAYPSQQSPQPGGQSQVLLDASAVIGSTVRSSEGKDIGKVNQLMIDPRDGRITTVVIGMGGMLGIGEKLVSMPWGSVKIGQDGGRIVVMTDQRLLDQVPSAKGDRKSEPAASPATGSPDSKNAKEGQNKDGQNK